jgi:hypothetical protein
MRMNKKLRWFYFGILFVGSSAISAGPVEGSEFECVPVAIEASGILFPKRDKSLPPPRPLPRVPMLPELPPR